MSISNQNLSLQPSSLPDVAQQFLDFGSEMRFNRLLAIHRRGSRIFASSASLEEFSRLLEPQLEASRVCNDFEWKNLMLLSAVAFQLADQGLRTRVALCAERNSARCNTAWSRMCQAACSAQLRSASLLALEEYLGDLEHLGYGAAVLLSQAAYGHGNRTMLARAIARMTLYEEALSFPGNPKVQYHLALAMQTILQEQSFEEIALLDMLSQLEDAPEQAAFRLGLRALQQLCPFTPLPEEPGRPEQLRESAG